MDSTVCGCWFVIQTRGSYPRRQYLPQVDLQAHTTILSTASRTKLRQIFVNHFDSEDVNEIRYSFPLYDGVSVVSFKCQIGNKLILGVVKEKNQARADYDKAVSAGKAAGLLEQMHEASDVFSTKLGNIPKGGKAVIEIEYVGELKHDAQLDGVRFTIPTSIAPRYGSVSPDSATIFNSSQKGKIDVTVDVEVDEGTHVEGLSSPSHPIAMTMGRTTTHKDEFRSNRASATLSLGTVILEKDFIIVVNAQDQAIPRAMLEQHSTLPRHRALMTTLVPKFNLPNIHPEIVFVVDRSGSMGGKMRTLIEALKVFLKSLPLSAKFNICSFGSSFSYLFPKSQPYDERSLHHALQEVERFDANFGGTELLQPIKETVKNRLGGIPLEIMVLTDGEIWNQQEAFDFLNEATKSDVRLFSLGIGNAASTSLVEGLARAGNGFAQFVRDDEKMDKRVIRMLKAALTPHITDYRLEVNYEEATNVDDDDFEIVDSASTTTTLVDRPARFEKSAQKESEPTPISLFDPNFKETKTNPPAGRYDHLPRLKVPKEVQAPSTISGLFPYSRTYAYLLLPNSDRPIKSVLLKGTYNGRPVQLEIPVQKVGSGKTLHQLAAKKAMLETEEGRGWLSMAKSDDGTLLKAKHAADWDRIIEREAVRLGVKFQVAGKYCSFIAVEKDIATGKASERKPLDTSQKQSQPAGDPDFNLDFSTLASEDVFDNFDVDSFLKEEESFDSSADELEDEGWGTIDPGNHHTDAGAAQKRFGGSRPLGQVQYRMAAMPASAAPSKTSRGGINFGGLLKKKKTVDKSRDQSVQQVGAFASAASFEGERKERKSSQSPPSLFGSAAAAAAPPPPPGGAALFSTASAFGQVNQPQPSGFGSSTAYSSMQSRSRDMSSLQQQRPVAPVPGVTDLATPISSRRSDADSWDAPDSWAARPKGAFGINPTARNRAPATISLSESIPPTVEGKMHKIIGLQSFNGSWDSRDELFKLVSVSKAEADKAMSSYQDESVKATVLAIAWLQKVAAKEVEVWEMIVDKAKQWLASVDGIGDVDGAISQAVKVLFG